MNLILEILIGLLIALIMIGMFLWGQAVIETLNNILDSIQNIETNITTVKTEDNDK